MLTDVVCQPGGRLDLCQLPGMAVVGLRTHTDFSEGSHALCINLNCGHCNKWSLRLSDRVQEISHYVPGSGVHSAEIN